jgi:hypothetical protein
MDFLCQYPEEDLVVKAAEAVRDVALDKPRSAGPGVVDLLQRGMASASFPEPVRPVRKLRLVVCLEKQAGYFADEFIGP